MDMKLNYRCFSGYIKYSAINIHITHTWKFNMISILELYPNINYTTLSSNNKSILFYMILIFYRFIMPNIDMCSASYRLRLYRYSWAPTIFYIEDTFGGSRIYVWERGNWENWFVSTNNKWPLTYLCMQCRFNRIID